MASPSTKGYDLKLFKDTLEDRFKCIKCKLILRDPYMTTCCCEEYCKECISEIQRNKEPCITPGCNQSKYNVFESKKTKSILDKEICYCHNKELGCGWEGSLDKLEEHLHPKRRNPAPEQPSVSECKYVNVACIYCSEMYLRKDIDSHEKEHCKSRPFECEYCGYSSTFRNVTEEHILECRLCPVPCTQNCGASFKRKDLERHKTNDCPNTEVACEVDGCDAKVLRKDMSEHMEKDVSKHALLLSRIVKELKLEKEREAQKENQLKVLPITLTLDNFAQHKNAKDSWQSDVLYTCENGYALHLSIHPAGRSTAQLSGYISVYIYITKGRFDDQLRWPFKGNFTVQLLNQQGSDDHHSKTTTVQGNRSLENKGVGWLYYVRLKELEPKYLQNNCLKFEVLYHGLSTNARH